MSILSAALADEKPTETKGEEDKKLGGSSRHLQFEDDTYFGVDAFMAVFGYTRASSQDFKETE